MSSRMYNLNYGSPLTRWTARTALPAINVTHRCANSGVVVGGGGGVVVVILDGDGGGLVAKDEGQNVSRIVGVYNLKVRLRLCQPPADTHTQIETIAPLVVLRSAIWD